MSRAAVRASARLWRSTALGLPVDELVPADKVIEAAARAAALPVVPLESGDPLLWGGYGVLDRDAGRIWLDSSMPRPAQLAVAAHEFAHFVLHPDVYEAGAASSAVLDDPEDADPEAVAGYSPRQRREVDANVWGAELLLPASAVRKAFYERGMGADRIAATLGIAPEIARSQMRASLLHIDIGPKARPGGDGPKPVVCESPREPQLDDSQRAAATVERGPFLLTAGPGAGKTRTLIARCAHLVQGRGVAPTKILALTFSRKAAAEMQDRLVAAGIGTLAAGPWVGTFHALCLDVLRRFPAQADLPENWTLLGETESAGLLERELPRLDLTDLSDPAAPTAHLRDVLGAISRAKDELCGPERYRQLVEAHIVASNGGRDSDEARRLLETAAIYDIYEQVKHRTGRLDFGDLLVRTVRLLESHPAILAGLQAQYPHIVADEYQDVNFASARLLRLLAGDAASGLWAVGDRRQSIYRFRGASPANVAQFGRDYAGGHVGELSVNYRSQPPIVDVFACAAERMSAAEPGRFRGWRCARGTSPGGGVRWFCASDARSQAAGMAREMKSLHRSGLAYSDQAVLCRSHGEAARLADMLTELGIPVLYVGYLLERPVIRDLLCVLDSFAECGSTGPALVRRLGRISGGLVDESEAARAAGASELSGCVADRLLSDPGARARDTNLCTMLETVAAERSPAAMLGRLLFDWPEFLRNLANGRDELQRAVDLLAIRRLLDLAAEITGAYSREFAHVQGGEVDAPIDPTSWFLRQLRRTVQSGARLQATAGDEDEVDAVRLMTIHAAKGLEFRAVFLPNLSDGHFPPRDRAPYIAEPRGMCDDRAVGDSGYDEETCLFFVALSRARDHLILSRSDRQAADGRDEQPSPLLRLIQPGLAAIGVRETRWPTEALGRPVDHVSEDVRVRDPKPRHMASALETYRHCPRRYYYEHQLGFAGADNRGPYALYRRCLKEVTGWMQDEWRERAVPDADAVRQRAEQVWAEEGVPDDLYRADCRRRSIHVLLQVRAMYEKRSATQRPATDPVLAVELENCVVHVAADLIAQDSNGTVHVVRHRDGRQGRQDHTEPILSLLRLGAQAAFRGRPAQVELEYGRTAEIVTAAPNAAYEPGRVTKYVEAAAGIARGDFDPAPNPRSCPGCPFYFVCPE